MCKRTFVCTVYGSIRVSINLSVTEMPLDTTHWQMVKTTTKNKREVVRVQWAHTVSGKIWADVHYILQMWLPQLLATDGEVLYSLAIVFYWCAEKMPHIKNHSITEWGRGISGQLWERNNTSPKTQTQKFLERPEFGHFTSTWVSVSSHSTCSQVKGWPALVI